MSSSNFKVTQGGDEQATKTAHVMWPRVSKIAPAMWHWNDFMRMLFPAWLMILAAGCSINGTPFSGDNAVSLADNNRVSPPLISQNNSARIRLSLFTDARVFDNPRKLGTGAEYVSGLSGKDILLDQEVAMAVANLMKQRLYDAGFPVRDAVGDAQFELNGVVKELTYNVKARDEITIAIQATLLDANSGKIIWSGLVTERNDRFACVAGNNKNDVANYLRKELAIVTAKITDAISASLVATHPELFKPIPGAQPVPGVTVLVAPPVTESPDRKSVV